MNSIQIEFMFPTGVFKQGAVVSVALDHTTVVS